jgi:hypothetical protein
MKDENIQKHLDELDDKFIQFLKNIKKWCQWLWDKRAFRIISYIVVLPTGFLYMMVTSWYIVMRLWHNTGHLLQLIGILGVFAIITGTFLISLMDEFKKKSK